MLILFKILCFEICRHCETNPWSRSEETHKAYLYLVISVIHYVVAFAGILPTLGLGAYCQPPYPPGDAHFALLGLSKFAWHPLLPSKVKKGLWDLSLGIFM